MPSKYGKPAVLGLGGMLLIGGAYWGRQSLGIELDPRSLRDYVNGLGAVGPIVMIGLITFRSLLGIPSQLILIAAGLCFGTVAGAVYGAVGLTASGIGTFLIARHAGREAVERRVPSRIKDLLEQAGERPGAIFVCLATGYPIGFITAYHAVAGITTMPLGMFAVALAVGSAVRAATYTFFGNALIQGGITPVLQATAILAVLFALPLLVPRIRAWVKHNILARE